MIKRIFMNPLFLIGFLFIVGLLGGSFYFDLVMKDNLPDRTTILYDEEGLPRYTAPFPPMKEYPLGTDKNGYQVLYKILEGAKYTILIAFFITVLRMVFSTFFGIVFRRVLLKVERIIKGLINSFHFAPLSLIAYFVVAPVALIFSWSFSAETEIIFSIAVLTLLAVPTLSLLIMNETDQILQYEFIRNAKILGGSHLHVMNRHVGPYLGPKLFIIFNQQMIQVLLLFAHLGVLGLYIGGPEFKSTIKEPTYMNEVMEGKEPEVIQTITSMSNEWGGLIAIARKEFLMYPWQIYFPALAFALTILAFTLMLEGMKRAANIQVERTRQTENSTESPDRIKEEDFRQIRDEKIS